MGRNRFVSNEIVRLELSDDDWIEVKKRLSYAEQQRLATGAFSRMGMADKEIELKMDSETFNCQRLLIWIVDCSFVNAKGKQVPVTLDAIKQLDPDTAAEIDDALAVHIEAVAAEKNALKPKPEPETK